MVKRTEQSNTYAEKFFNKKMHPGTMGTGFVGIITDTRHEKYRKNIFPTVDDLMED